MNGLWSDLVAKELIAGCELGSQASDLTANPVAVVSFLLAPERPDRVHGPRV
jgi:hypothetical protein